eukprot:6251021-Amphidinium_carterae.1
MASDGNRPLQRTESSEDPLRSQGTTASHLQRAPIDQAPIHLTQPPQPMGIKTNCRVMRKCSCFELCYLTALGLLSFCTGDR